MLYELLLEYSREALGSDFGSETSFRSPKMRKQARQYGAAWSLYLGCSWALLGCSCRFPGTLPAPWCPLMASGCSWAAPEALSLAPKEMTKMTSTMKNSTNRFRATVNFPAHLKVSASTRHVVRVHSPSFNPIEPLELAQDPKQTRIPKMTSNIPGHPLR